jgi:hypothetical protein
MQLFYVRLYLPLSFYPFFSAILLIPQLKTPIAHPLLFFLFCLTFFFLSTFPFSCCLWYGSIFQSEMSRSNLVPAQVGRFSSDFLNDSLVIIARSGPPWGWASAKNACFLGVQLAKATFLILSKQLAPALDILRKALVSCSLFVPS